METIEFYKVNEPYGFFSNFSPHRIFIKGEMWYTIEHYFQASKFESVGVRNRIKLIESPMEAAKEGRNRSNKLREDWEAVKVQIMKEALFCKFTQHPKLRKEILLTGSSLIVEHTNNDYYWDDGGDGSGQNILGKLLMELRSELQAISDNVDLVLPPWIAFPNMNQQDSFWRMGFGEDYITQWASFYYETDMQLYQQNFPETSEWVGFYDE